MNPLQWQPLTRDAFAPFGDVVAVDPEGGRDANQGSAKRVDFLASLQNARPGARANVVAIHSLPRPLPFDVVLLERHPHSSQLFSPMRVKRYVVIVAPTLPSGGPDEAGLRAFLASPTQAINYRQGTWHHPLLVLDEPADFTMLVWEDGTGGDCEERPLATRRRLSAG